MSQRELTADYGVRLEKNVLVAMADGTLIAADLHLPDAPGRFPVIFEYLPYRKDDVMAYRQQRHHYFAQHGFACAWVDIRGTGASGGIAADEYSRQEQDDACELIAWLAAQPWSNGNVGMTGISYGGFNAIQVAMRRPPALKAIIPAYATDDRYTDDIHYYGGARRCLEIFGYPLEMVAMNALPPHPEIVGERWAEIWEQHLRNEPWMLTWLEQQLDGDYWRQGSLRPGYEAITAATMMICGWSDCYRNWPLRTYAALQCPKRVLFGPWGHQWPNVAYPGPRIDYLRECVRWF
ncbi:MAG TPA: CocE/NonD family hydrolase, partial [Chloroflexota bacterium]|nr:CocE/NonD family hydrolase [Chloroflexota bacterium]